MVELVDFTPFRTYCSSIASVEGELFYQTTAELGGKVDVLS